jgi:hypothetical protein
VGNHCVAHGFCRYLNSDRNAPLHCLVDSASDSAGSSGVGLSNADCGVDAAAAAAVGYVMDAEKASGMDAEIVVDDDLHGVLDVGPVMDVVELFEMDVDVDSCDVDGLLTADVGNDE